MIGTNNGKRRRNAKSQAINLFVQNILDGGNSFKDHRGQAYTSRFIGGRSVRVTKPDGSFDMVWKGGGFTIVRGALSTGG